MRIIAIIYAAVILYGCSANIKVIGKYTSKSNPDYFELNPDSTFIYKYNTYHVKEYSFGRWNQYKAKEVVLKSYIQSRNIPIKVNQSFNKISTGSNIKLNFETDLDLKNYKCAIFINDTLYSLKGTDLIVPTELTVKEFENEARFTDIYFRHIRLDSLLTLKLDGPVRSLFFKIIKFEINSSYLNRQSLQTEKYHSSLGSLHDSLVVNVSVKDSLFNYIIFNNEKIKVRRKGILIFNDNTNSWWYVPRQLNSKNQ
jgi:hypothetical protein